MASISTIISLFVVLLATYCYAIPINSSDSIIKRESMKLAVEDGTINPEIHGKRSEDRDELPSERSTKDRDDEKRTIMEETTAEPKFHSKRSEDRDELPSERSTEDRDDKKRTIMEETTFESKVHGKRSESSEELTTERSMKKDRNHMKRRTMEEAAVESEVESKRSEDIDELTTENSMTEDRNDKKRTMEEATVESEVHPKRFDEKSQSSVNDVDNEKNEGEKKRFLDREDLDQNESENIRPGRNMESELFTKFESSTEFNTRAVRFMDGEPMQLELTTFSEPTSSFEVLARSTGLLDTPSVDDKIEGTSEKDITTPKSSY